jgi:glycosyltransferase involved in cell wall biosynthesis
MGILFIAEAVIFSDPAYRRRVLHMMREARGVAPVSLFVYGVAPASGRPLLERALAAAGVPPPRSIRLPAVRGLRPFLFLAALAASCAYVGCRLALRSDVRIVQAENLLAFLPLLPFARGRRRPAIVIDAHGAVPEEVRRKRPAAARVLYPLLKRLERAALSRADALIVPSEGFRAHATGTLGYPEGGIVVCPNRPGREETEAPGPGGRDAVREELGVVDRPVLVYSGGGASYQEPGRMIEAFRELLREEPDAFFLCLTTDPARFRALFEAAGLPGESRRVVRLEPAEVGRYLRAGDAGLLIRDDSVLNRVASPTKFAEYLAAGVPVLTTPGAGDAPAVVESEGVGRVVADLAPRSIARAAIDLLRLPEEQRSVMRKRCRETARRMAEAGDGTAAVGRLYRALAGREGGHA